MPHKKPIIIANWKMKLGLEESANLAKDLAGKVKGTDREVAICPAFTNLTEVAKILKNDQIKLGAQDCFWEKQGNFTGEISAREIKEIGGEFVILGHSERRRYLAETDEMIHQKIKAALAFNLIPIICVGETFDQRQVGSTDYILIQQTAKALEGVNLAPNQSLIVAYEPVWVIGSGQAILPAEAHAANRVIRQTLLDLFPAETVNNNFRIIYGGSVDEHNVNSFTSLEMIDGVLVGGASLKAASFLAIIKNV